MQIRANQVYHIDQILDIAKAVCFADDKLNLVVGSFNSGIAHPKAYGIQYMILVPFYLLAINEHGLSYCTIKGSFSVQNPLK